MHWSVWFRFFFLEIFLFLSVFLLHILLSHRTIQNMRGEVISQNFKEVKILKQIKIKIRKIFDAYEINNKEIDETRVAKFWGQIGKSKINWIFNKIIKKTQMVLCHEMLKNGFFRIFFRFKNDWIVGEIGIITWFLYNFLFLFLFCFFCCWLIKAWFSKNDFFFGSKFKQQTISFSEHCCHFPFLLSHLLSILLCSLLQSLSISPFQSTPKCTQILFVIKTDQMGLIFLLCFYIHSFFLCVFLCAINSIDISCFLFSYNLYYMFLS